MTIITQHRLHVVTKPIGYFFWRNSTWMVADMPATIPDLNNWQRAIAAENLTPAQINSGCAGMIKLLFLGISRRNRRSL
ncbi:hypothetical protein OGM63_15145 [Plectonema radiosum NIES-515]|uniref:Uncharacterized protein n=1 Tax=Plectonema radiosum NIES-515 TaxID=2986073 RepID=A0ABT3B0G4_9CYAN|nr:hypothetical protein [Plectonema radiosum]MCV3214836.1 hypothetical protein [Plectonema radiosum NIES-515]